MAEENNLYRVQAAKSPSLDTLKTISAELGFDITDDELPEYAEIVDNWIKDCTLLDELPEPTLPVKYPRVPGYRPSPEENAHNAWFYKTNVVGSGSGILAGKKVALKDNVALAGVPMMVGSRLMEGYVPEVDATVVTRILDAGGAIVGKAVCEDMCRSGSSFTSVNGAVLNPADKTRSAGGSSSGCAALLALGEVDLAVGGDQGGSIRIPASFCGVVGLKPTFELVPYTGIGAFEPSVDHVGPMANTVKDCALLLQALAGYDDGLDPRQSVNIPVPNYIKQLTGDVDGIKIGLIEEGFNCCDPEVQKVVKEAVYNFLPHAQIKNTSVPLHSKGPAIWAPSCRQGAYDTVYSKNGVGTGYRGFYFTSMAEHMSRAIKARANDFSPTMKVTCLYGELQNRRYGSKYYCKSMNLSRLLKQAYDEALSKCDVLIMPTTLTVAEPLPTAGLKVSEFVRRALGHSRNTSVTNASGHPAISINAGFVKGLPVGAMIIGKYFDEAMLLNVAHAFEMSRNSKQANI